MNRKKDLRYTMNIKRFFYMIFGHFLCPNFSNDFILFLKILKVFQYFPHISKVYREHLGTSLHLIEHHRSLNSIIFKNSNKSN